MAGTWRQFRRTALQRKIYSPDEVEQTNLRRCLDRWDLTALGVGSTLGVGVYFLIGHVAFNYAGPSVVLSFLIAAVVALFAGLCFAEFSARIPRAGAAYSYTYVALGEGLAFLVGWCNILELVLASASVAKGLSIHMDEIFNMTMTEWFLNIAPLPPFFLSPYFDFFACLIVLVMGGLLAIGAREVSLVNRLFSVLNIVGLLFIVVVGAFAADVGNWRIPAETVPPGVGGGAGGFFPFGVWGTLRGAAVCFVGFMGFESVCAAGEEAREPRRAVPLTILLVLLVTLVSYIVVAVVITMMVPYYMQDPMSAVSRVFLHAGWLWARWVVCFGALFGLYVSLFGCMFPLPRLLYAMSADGLLSGCCARVTAARQSPAVATLIATLVIATLAGLFALKTLGAWMCTGALLSYTAVAASVVIMRYRSDYTPGKPRYWRQVVGLGRSPTRASSRIVHVALASFIVMCVAMALVLTQLAQPLVPSLALHAAALLPLLVMALQPANDDPLLFKTPLVPLIPCLSIYCNVHMMVVLAPGTWLRAAAWLLLGLLLYCAGLCCRVVRNKKAPPQSTALGETKSPVQIIVEAPTPPDTIARGNGHIRMDDTLEDIQEEVIQENVSTVPLKEESVQLQQAYVENNEEKEAKIIDLLDQVLRAEEDTYGEAISLKAEEEVSTSQETAVHRKSLSELSDAGSDASLGNPVPSKYDVIAQVHREDLPRVNEEEEKSEREDVDDEQVTAFNDSDTNSRTDESGYSDTIDRNASESLEEIKQDAPYIPIPPPMDESYFRTTHFKKSYTIVSKHSKPPPLSDDEDEKPRESIKSNSTLGEDNITFGSDRQVHFMSKLNNIFQTKITGDEEEPRQRSRSTGSVVENTTFAPAPERPSMIMALQNEIISKEAAQNLRPVATEIIRPVNAEDKTEDDEDTEDSMSRQDLKSKLENIFATGGPQLLKPRLMKSNPPTPEDAYQTESSTESIPKLPKMDKNDTLKRQKDKFSAVLNSFRLSFKDDEV